MPGSRLRRGAAWAALAVATVSAAACGTSSKTTGPGSSTGSAAAPTANPPLLELNVGPAPWPASDNGVKRMAAAGLPALKAEALAFHVHAHLDVFLDGRRVPVAAGIGIDFVARRISTLHTHDTSGWIHMEAPRRETFTLGQLFTLWGVRLTATCVGGYCVPQMPVRFYVDGHARTGDPAAIRLVKHEEIAIVIGTPPADVPSSYDFQGSA